MQFTKSFISWVGGKSKLLWLIHKLFPPYPERFIDVFGGSGTVLLSRPLVPGALEVYNDFNGDLVNLFFCVKNRTMALLLELGFLPLNSRDDFEVLYKFFNREEITEDYLSEELALTEKYLKPPNRDAIIRILKNRTARGDVKRAADYFRLVRYSFSSNTKSFAGKNCDIRKFFYLIWECSRRLADVVIENKDFESLFQQYDREKALFYCDPPYYEAEGVYAKVFSLEDHYRLHDTAIKATGYVMISYNYCHFILDLYKEFYIFYTVRANSMSTKAGAEYEEIIITNYDPRVYENAHHSQLTLFSFLSPDADAERYQLINEPESPLKGEQFEGGHIYEDCENRHETQPEDSDCGDEDDGSLEG